MKIELSHLVLCFFALTACDYDDNSALLVVALVVLTKDTDCGVFVGMIYFPLLLQT